MIGIWSFNYSLNNIFLSRLNSVKDLSILSDAKLLFSNNIIYIKNEPLYISLFVFYFYRKKKHYEVSYL